jgi:hypothetical protein
MPGGHELWVGKEGRRVERWLYTREVVTWLPATCHYHFPRYNIQYLRNALLNTYYSHF